MKIIDGRGLECPKPVLETKKWLDNSPEQTIKVIVDNLPAKENVTRFLKSQGYAVTIEETDDIIELTGNKDGVSCETLPKPKTDDKTGDDLKKTLILITNDKMGLGDGELGSKLMKNFIATLEEYSGLWKLVFVNGGVKLCSKGSNSVDDLKKFEEGGLKILVCGTCLDHYNLLEDKEVGETTNMLDIITSLEVADKVITL